MASDNFTDTNGTALATHDSNWGSIGDDGTSNAYSVGNFEIQNNEVVCNNIWTNGGARYTSSSIQRSQFVWPGGQGINPGGEQLFICINATSTRQGYAVRINGNATDFTSATLFYDNGGGGQVAMSGTVTFTYAHSSDVTFNLYKDGGNIKFDVNGTNEINTADTYSLTGGNPGFCVKATSVIPALDDWTDGVGVSGLLYTNRLFEAGARLWEG